MLSCILFLMPFLAFQETSLNVIAGRTYPSSKHNQYERNTMGGVSCNLGFTDNLESNFQYSHTNLGYENRWWWKSAVSYEICASLRTVTRAFNFMDVYAFGGGGFYVNPSRKANASACYGLGLRKIIKPPISLELNFLIHHVFDEDPSMRDWRSFSVGIGVRFPRKVPEQISPAKNEAEVVVRYLSPELRESMKSKYDEERNELVERFWKANDPTPDTPENEFREKIHSRIRYADRWFRDAREGWETERGRIWILLGEPDEIIREEEHILRTECWIYHKTYEDIAPVVFVFQQRETFTQVFSNIPGESGFNVRLEPINPAIDRYTQAKWYIPEVYDDWEDDRIRLQPAPIFE